MRWKWGGGGREVGEWGSVGGGGGGGEDVDTLWPRPVAALGSGALGPWP